MTEPSRPPSPLDPYLAQFLAMVDATEAGFQPGIESAKLASRLEIPREFVEALFTSSRARGLIKPIYGRGNKVRWAVSPVGKALMRGQAS